MKLLRFLIIASVFSTSIHSQTFQWVNASPLDITSNPSLLRTPLAMDTAGSLVCARLAKFKQLYGITYLGDIEISKLSSSGSLVWKTTAYGKVNVSKLAVDNDDNIICSGTFRDTLAIDTAVIFAINSNPDNFILKLDDSGNLVWLTNGSGFVPEFGEITSLANDLHTGNILVGTSQWGSGTQIVALDPDGNTVSVIEQNNTSFINDMKLDKPGNLWVTGFSFAGDVSFNGLDTIAPFSYNEFVVKYDPSGTAQWVNFIRDVTANFFDIETDDSGNGYLAGSLLDSTSFGDLHAHGPQWSYDYFVTKMDGDGNFTWLHELPLDTVLSGDAAAGADNFLYVGEDGNSYLTGFFRGEVDYGNGVVLSAIDWYDVFVLSLSPEGEVRWAKSAGSALYDQGNGITGDSDGNLYLSGLVSHDYLFDTFSGVGANYNLFLAKLGTGKPVVVDDGSSDRVSVDEFRLMQNYPNPFNPTTTISYQLPQAGQVSLKVYDVLGKEVASLVNERKPAGSYSVEFEGADLASGIYLYQLRAGGFVEVRKMVLLR